MEEYEYKVREEIRLHQMKNNIKKMMHSVIHEIRNTYNIDLRELQNLLIEVVGDLIVAEMRKR